MGVVGPPNTKLNRYAQIELAALVDKMDCNYHLVFRSTFEAYRPMVVQCDGFGKVSDVFSVTVILEFPPFFCWGTLPDRAIAPGLRCDLPPPL